VVKVSDGDTLTVLVIKTQIRVRLDAIDAPERHEFCRRLEINRSVKNRKKTGWHFYTENCANFLNVVLLP
jgi:endonuclease YncB( thermonuclease family)